MTMPVAHSQLSQHDWCASLRNVTSNRGNWPISYEHEFLMPFAFVQMLQIGFIGLNKEMKHSWVDDEKFQVFFTWFLLHFVNDKLSRKCFFSTEKSHVISIVLQNDFQVIMNRIAEFFCIYRFGHFYIFIFHEFCSNLSLRMTLRWIFNFYITNVLKA